jgi:aminodeoxyfutalosine synthase
METMTVLDAVAERVSRGDSLTQADARAILATTDLIAVGMLADEVRRTMHGRRTTFVRVFEVHVEAPPAALQSGVHAGELRIVGRPQSADQAVAAVRAVAALVEGPAKAGDDGPAEAGDDGPARAGDYSPAKAGHYNPTLTGFTLADLWTLAPSETALGALGAKLREAGLEAIADVSLDGLDDVGAAVRAVRQAGLAALRLTVNTLPEGSDERISAVERARDLQASIGGFRAFAPLPRTVSAHLPTTGYDDVKQVALARLVVNNIESIQVDWPLYGPKLAQVALTFGADDVDGIAAFDPGVLGTRRSPIEEIQGNIHAAALEAVERNGRFSVVESS